MGNKEIKDIIGFIDGAIRDLVNEININANNESEPKKSAFTEDNFYGDEEAAKDGRLSYAMFLDELARKEYEAMLTKLDEHGIKGADPLELMRCSSDWSNTDLAGVYWAYAGRHFGALLRHEHLDGWTLKRRLMDAYGYVTLGLYILETGGEL